MESTLVLIKPDAVSKKLVGNILHIYEVNGLTITALQMLIPDQSLLEKHYQEHIGKPYYESLIQFMRSGPVIAIRLSGENAIEVTREINGATNPANARPCTIRYLYGSSTQQNAVHGSANPTDAARELALWFSE